VNESIGGRIEILGHAIATLTESLKAIDAAMSSDQSQVGREVKRATILRIVERIETLAEMQTQLATSFNKFESVA